MRVQIITAAAVALAFAGVSTAHAQIDYRNLDDHRPVRSEDAYPIERYAFELMLPWRLESEAAGKHHQFTPEIAYGLLANFQLGIKAPFAVADDGGSTEQGLGGLQPFALYNFNTESPHLPALAIRVDAAFPVGPLAGDHPRLGMKAIATRSFGLTRVHLNVARGVGSEEGAPGLDAIDRWSGSVAVDHTFFRQSLLAIGEVGVDQAREGAQATVDASIGLRYQWRPTFVWDAGLTHSLRRDPGPAYAITIGLSHAFAVRGLMPARP